jgi:hypothetical protein
MVLVGFLNASSYPQLLSAVLFFPIPAYFWLLIIPKRNKAMIFPAISPSKDKVKLHNTKTQTSPSLANKGKVVEELAEEGEEFQVDDAKFTGKIDRDRRMFLKLIGSAGLSVFMMSIFTKKAQAAFFGSVPGPGTVAVKDSSGTVIDPAEKQPTDGYRISRLDDSDPAYYGFTNKDGGWFIMKEDSLGNYTYVVGSSGFDTTWSVHDQSPPTGPTYQEFSDAFS